MKIVYCCLICLLFGLNTVKAQDKINFDSIKTAFPKEDAVIISKNVKVTYYMDEANILKAKSTVSEKILVLKDDRFEFQYIEIPFNQFENVNFLSGKVFNITNNGEKKLIENIKIRNAQVRDYYIKNIFYNDLKIKSISMTSEVKERYLIDYSYETDYTDLKFLNTFYPYQDLPTINFTISAIVPKNVKAEILPFNVLNNVVKQSKTSNDETELSCESRQTTIPYNTFFQAPSAYSIPHFIVLTRSYIDNKGNTISILNSLNDLYSWYKSLINELKPDKDYLKNVSNSIVKNASSDEQKVEKIFKWVKDNISYIAFEDGIAGFKPEEAQNVEKKRYGDCKGMANLLTELLRAQGFDAHHTWIGTNSIPYSYSNVPSLCVDNHMICALFMNNKTYLLDATGDENTWNDYPYYLQGKEALIGLNNEYKVFNVPISPASQNICEMNYTIDAVNDHFIAKGSVRLTGAFYADYKGAFDNISRDEKKDFPFHIVNNLFKYSLLATRADLSISNGELRINFTANADPLVSKQNNQILLSDVNFYYFPLFYLDSLLNTPLFIEFPFQFKSSATISGGMKLNSPVAYSKTTNSFSVSRSVNSSGSAIKSEYSILLNKPILYKDDFQNWNTLVNDFYTKYGIIQVSK